jgi:uncharacterized protein YbbC (DUF1343 family)
VAAVALGIDKVLADPRGFSEMVHLAEPGGTPGGRPVKVGLVTSNATKAGIPGVESTRQALLRADIPLTVLFSPEHGLSGKAPDGTRVDDGVDRQTGLPVISLYGSRLAPDAAALAGLDLLLFDLQDVGVRFYTFLWTLTHLMESCADAGIPVRILDRPNPLGGDPVHLEGPVLDVESASSLLGRWSVPIRHSLTIGEMALLLRAEMGLAVDLGIVTMDGWRRSMMWPETGLPYHPPSPGLPTFSSALLYPGLALLEATNIHEGRGTEVAFQWFGAPWMDAGLLAEALNEAGITGVRALPRPLRLPLGGGARPGWNSGDSSLPCPGVRLEVTDPKALRPVALGLRLLTLLRTLCPRDFQWAPYPTAANPSGEGHLTSLLGSGALAKQIQDHPETLDEIRIRSFTDAANWWERAEPHLLYS